MLENAPHEDDCRCEQCVPSTLYDGKTPEEVCEIAGNQLSEALAKCDSPLVHKVMVLEIIDNFIEWHTKVALKMAEMDNTRSSIGWARDAGKFQAIHNILQTISLDEDDFTMPLG